MSTETQRVQTIRAWAAMIIPLFFMVMFAGCIIGTYHQPHPNGIKVAVVGPDVETSTLRAALAHAGRGAFDISRASTGDDAMHDVEQPEIEGAFVPSVDPQQPATLYIASAAGRLPATAVETLARGVTSAQGQQLVIRDLRPLPSGDVVMEATSDYCKPPFLPAGGTGFDPWPVNAKDVKLLPGRPKTDRLDAVWLAKVRGR